MELLNILLPIFTLLLGSSLTYLFGVKIQQSASARKHREEQYSKLLIKLQGFVGNTVNAKTKKEFLEEQYKGWLYCSDDVVKAINKMIQLVIEGGKEGPDPEEGRKAVGNIVVAMRKDLNSKTTLDYSYFRYIDVIDKR